MTWTRLSSKDDWGHITVYAGDYKTDPNAVPLPDIACHVRWPDGTEDTLAVVMVKEHTTVGDMGHVYDVQYIAPYFRLLVHGAEFKVRAMDLDVEVWRD